MDSNQSEEWFRRLSHLTSFYLEVEYSDGRSQIKVHTDERTQARMQRPLNCVAWPIDTAND